MVSKLINAAWEILARNLGTKHPEWADWIIKVGQRTPYTHIYHKDGTDYMGRWWLMPRWLLGKDEDKNPYPFRWLPRIVRLHHIRSEDWDRDIHDHPSWYRTIILRGWYIERDIYGEEYLRSQGNTKTANAETFHRIIEISPGGVWTIFIMKPKTNEWGFLVNSVKIPWREYEGRSVRE